MHVSIVVATAENGIIGKDGDMPWHIPADLKYFKGVTSGKPVVMGRRTYQSIGRPLPNRTNIVVTRDKTFTAKGIQVVHNLNEALVVAREIAKMDDVDEIMVIGGGQIYAEVLGSVDRVYLTEIHATIDGDTSFPALDASLWRETSRHEENAGDDGTPACSFVVLERIHGKQEAII